MSTDKHSTATLFEDAKKSYNREQAVVEANRCLFCTDAPCMKACPTHIDIPQFIRKITTDNVENSAKTIFESNIFGVSCARVCPVEVLCVGACVYNQLDEPPIQIGKLQLYATDKADENHWQFFTAGKDTGKSVGLIGAGPASLACAHALRVHGHRVTIYEKKQIIGGLNTTGIAPYKMSAKRALAEAHRVLEIGGIELKTSVAIGEDVSVETLEQQHDALFFGMGLGDDTPLGLPGEDLPGVIGAVAMVERIKLGRVPPGGLKHCVVIGGGNTAMDAVREACGLGIPEVTLVYRGTQQHMSGYAHEWVAAQLAGAQAQWQALPVAFHGEHHVEFVECIQIGRAHV
jgi:glutamate synthase (NADPH/NADH) small chain